MKITLRLIFSLVCVASVAVLTFTGLRVQQERARLEADVQRQATVLAESLRETVGMFLQTSQLNELQVLLERFGNREHLAGVAVYTADGQPLAITASLPARFQTLPPIGREAIDANQSQKVFQLDEDRHRWYLHAVPLWADGKVAGALLLAYDAGDIDRNRLRLWRQDFVQLLLQVFLISLTTLVIVQWSLLRPISKTIEWMRRLRTGEAAGAGALPKGELFSPLSREVSRMARSLIAARAAAEEEARLRNLGESRWTPDRLRDHVRTILKGRSLLVVSNREPYIHVRQGRQIQCRVPPGGLVTAMESVLRACGGTWIAHGSGNADRETVDRHGRLKAPPEAPVYTLRRVWLSEQEEQGYYYGFANEGLWPLCHIAHTRPLFRAEDWNHYARVNEKFADVVAEETAEMDNPCVLIQDYHFALLPRLIKERRPDAKVALFWHIPWPNPEAFGICPWARELLQGMLGADLVGFHIQFHCNNFLDTVDRMLESRIDWERFVVNRADHATWVKPFPISVAAVPPAEEASAPPSFAQEKAAVLKSLGVAGPWLGVGVDRLDYTKGLSERLLAIERFLERYPRFQEQFTFVELGAPSRTLIPRYQELETSVETEVERINRRFATKTWKPIVFLKKQHSHQEIASFYRAADVCLVTSLHDGMNLVSKEFVAARTDERGVLVLSQFAGASRELRDALIVNPYDVDQMADAIHGALTMDPEEQQGRMQRMREMVHEHNVYRWAAHLVRELARLRPDTSALDAPFPSQGT